MNDSGADAAVHRAYPVRDWLQWQAPYLTFAYAYFPITLTKRLLLKEKRAYIGLDPIVRRFWDKWGFLSNEVTGRAATGPPIWINMNSGGEVIMSLALLRALDVGRAQYALSTESYDSFDLLSRTYPGQVFFPPWDTEFPARRVLTRLQPRAVVFVQNAVFPVMLRRARRRGIKTILVNGLLSRNVDRGDKAIERALALGFCRQLDAVAAQTEEDAEAFRRRGVPADRITVTGDLARDLEPSRLTGSERARVRAELGFGPHDHVFIAASTHGAERDVVIQILRTLRSRSQTTRFIVSPRQVHQTYSFVEGCRAAGFRTVTRSELLRGLHTQKDQDVVVLDTFGELRTMYGIADVAFIGSSLVALNSRAGGHNPLEALVHGTIPLFGPHMNLWPTVVAALRDVWAGVYATSPETIAHQAASVLAGDAPVAALRQVGSQYLRESHGAVDRTVSFLRRELEL